MKILRSLCWLALGLSLLSGCGRDPGLAREVPPPKTVADWFTIGVGGVPARMQLALLPAEQERGLMERRDLGPDEGMIFVFRTPQRQSFWMHDTPTPLDGAYFGSDGALAEVYPFLPFDERPVTSRSPDIRFVLEMNQGWFARHGLAPGARLDLSALTAALKARGFDPAAFGLAGP